MKKLKSPLSKTARRKERLPNNECCVYVIGKTIDIENELEFYKMNPNDSGQFLNCYVGVTARPYGRWTDHDCLRKCREPARVSKFIKKHNLNFEDNFKIIYQGDQDLCLELERFLRPTPHMSLNEAAGGNMVRHHAAA